MIEISRNKLPVLIISATIPEVGFDYMIGLSRDLKTEKWCACSRILERTEEKGTNLIGGIRKIINNNETLEQGKQRITYIASQMITKLRELYPDNEVEIDTITFPDDADYEQVCVIINSRDDFTFGGGETIEDATEQAKKIELFTQDTKGLVH